MDRALSGALLLALALLLPVGEARAIDFKIGNQPLRLDLTESMYLSAHLDDGNPEPTTKNYGEFINRLNAQLAWNKFLLSVRFDSGAWVHTPQDGDRSPYVSPVGAPHPINCPTVQKSSPQDYNTCVVQPNDPRLVNRFKSPDSDVNRGPLTVGKGAFYLEKLSLSYAGRYVEATLGDFYAQIGRGLVLSIRKVDELGVDTTITGAKLAVHYKDFSAMVLGGITNIQNFDQAQAQFIPDPNDIVAALHVDYRVLSKVLVGAHVVYGKPSGPLYGNDHSPDGYYYSKRPADYAYTLRPGFVIDAPKLTRWLGIYAEYARQQDRVQGQSSVGNAFYGAVNVYAGRTSWLLEVKNYDNYLPWMSSQNPFGNIVYMVPPTLEQITTQLSQNTNILAGRLRVDLRVNPKLNFFYSVELAQEHPSSVYDATLLDMYGGAELRWNEGRSHFFPTVGMRSEHNGGNPTVSPDMPRPLDPFVEERLYSVQWDAAQELPKHFALEAAGLVWIRQKGQESVPGNGDNRWVEGNAYLSLKWSPKLVASIGYEFTTITKERYNTHDFVNGSLLWNITPGTSLGLFVGGNRPGIKCVSGICRDFPAFQGARLEFVLRL